MDGVSALRYAQSSPIATRLLPELMAHGADPDLPDKQGVTPLSLAKLSDEPEITRLLTRQKR